MIRNDADLQATQARLLLFERIPAESRRTYSPSNYVAMAEGYVLAIDQLQADMRAYLRRMPDLIEAVRCPSVVRTYLVVCLLITIFGCSGVERHNVVSLT